MGTPLELRLELEALTPLYLGGADQDRPELRAASLKGLLRFWYRAADPKFRDRWARGPASRESVLFGGTADGSGQSPFLLRIFSDAPPTGTWRELNSPRFNRGAGKNTRNGLVYLGYPFQMGDNKRREYIVPGHRFSVRCLIPRPWQDKEKLRTLRRALTASFWLLGHGGGAGSRSRRGFGALALTAWKSPAETDEWPELSDLPLLHTAASADEWRAGLEEGISTIRSWFGDFEASKERGFHHPHLGPRAEWTLLGQGFPRDRWADALNHLGTLMQDFRVRRSPDYEEVKDQVRAQGRQGGRPLRRTPERAAFGLPLTFRYTSVRGRPVPIVPFDSRSQSTMERHGSLLLLRPALAGESLYPLVLRLDGDLPGRTPPGAIRGAGRPLLPGEGDLLADFLAHIRER